MKPKIVKQAVAYAAEISEQNNERIVVLVNEQNETTEVRPYLGDNFSYEQFLNALIINFSDGKKFIDIDSINSIHCYKQKI